jgi:hypothetical protein
MPIIATTETTSARVKCPKAEKSNVLIMDMDAG